ncbi:MAG: hypothetical protein GXX98_07835 [Planctomycetes bacterium]|nr:hypothetical protein [Planctomycetota bacterium]
MNGLVTFLAGVLALSAITSTARDAVPAQSVIVVVGAPGMPEYLEQFAQWSDLWKTACSEGGGRFHCIGLNGSDDVSDRMRLRELLAAESQGDGPLWLVLIGHGTYDGRTARFNLRGPDLTTDDLVEWLAPIQRPVALINTASASAPFLTALSAPGRVIVTATKSGFEQNYTRFGQYLAEAMAEPAADLDKDGQVSLLEAFLTASHRTQAFYQGQGWLATEHALLDDDGDGLGTPADWFRGIRPVRQATGRANHDSPLLDGYRAHQLHLIRSDIEAAMPPDLRAERDRLELEVMKLRDTKGDLPEAQYYTELETLLRQIARIYERLDRQ